MSASNLPPNEACPPAELADIEGSFSRALGERFASDLVASAPGRVNLIGEHTDYNGGFVFPIAIDRSIHAAVRLRPDRVVRTVARDRDDADEFPLDAIERHPEKRWANYVRGVAAELMQVGFPVRGMDLAIGGNIPVGAGVSSSAAIELATARACLAAAGADMPLPELALLCQRVENGFVGVSCGIMDQFISALGERSKAMLLDCESLAYEMVPLPESATFVVCDTRKERALGDSAYNERRSQCEAGAAKLGVPSLRHATLEQLEAAEAELESLTWRRCRHVVTEIDRALKAAEALKRGDLAAFGRLMDASHVSLRDDYEVSCLELDIMTDAAREAPGCLGARLTGAGFGGCAVALVEPAHISAFIPQTAERYQAETGLQPSLYAVRASDGASVGLPLRGV